MHGQWYVVTHVCHSSRVSTRGPVFASGMFHNKNSWKQHNYLVNGQCMYTLLYVINGRPSVVLLLLADRCDHLDKPSLTKPHPSIAGRVLHLSCSDKFLNIKIT